MASHLFGLTQDMVARSQEQKCGLKYVMHISLYRKEFLLIDMGCENKKATHHMTGGLIDGSFNYYS
jgi:hypothetical protein